MRSEAIVPYEGTQTVYRERCDTPIVSLPYRPSLNGLETTALEYPSFPLLMSPPSGTSPRSSGCIRAPSATPRKPAKASHARRPVPCRPMEPTAPLAPPHKALTRLADSEHRVVAAGEADLYRLSPRVRAGLRTLAQFGRRWQHAERRYAPVLALLAVARLLPFTYPSP